MAALPYIQLYVADYLADTVHLTAEEHGAYLLLIMNYWQRGKPLPLDDKRLALIARVPNERWTDVRNTLSEFFHETENGWEHHRINEDLAAVTAKSTKASLAGMASGAARRAAKLKAQEQSSNGRSTDVPTEPNHTDTEANTEAEKHIQAVFLYWCEVMGKNPKTTRLTDKRREKIKTRLKHYTVDEIQRAIDNCNLSPHHRGETKDNQTVFNDIELICRSDTNLERFRDMQFKEFDYGRQSLSERLNDLSWLRQGEPENNQRAV